MNSSSVKIYWEGRELSETRPNTYFIARVQIRHLAEVRTRVLIVDPPHTVCFLYDLGQSAQCELSVTEPCAMLFRYHSHSPHVSAFRPLKSVRTTQSCLCSSLGTLVFMCVGLELSITIIIIVCLFEKWKKPIAIIVALLHSNTRPLVLYSTPVASRSYSPVHGHYVLLSCAWSPGHTHLNSVAR